MSRTAPFLSLTATLGLMACVGEVAPDGTAQSGPLGQAPMLIEPVQDAIRMAIKACDVAVTNGSPVAVPAGNFVPIRNGIAANIDNPDVLGRSRVTAVLNRHGECTVEAKPAFPVEINTMRELVKQTLGSAAASKDIELFIVQSSYDGAVQAVFK